MEVIDGLRSQLISSRIVLLEKRDSQKNNIDTLKENIKINNKKEYFYLKKPDAVVIVAHNENKIAFLKAKRHLIDY